MLRTTYQMVEITKLPGCLGKISLHFSKEARGAWHKTYYSKPNPQEHDEKLTRPPPGYIYPNAAHHSRNFCAGTTNTAPANKHVEK